MPKLPVKVFTSQIKTLPIEQPNLAEIQFNSFKWFKEVGLKELFLEVSPIRDYGGKEWELYFTDYYFDEPKYDETQSQFKDLTYEAPLRVKVKLVNKITKKIKEQEVYMGDFPMMTGRGTFIINGVERVVISQLIRSAEFTLLLLWRGVENYLALKLFLIMELG
jgi:DNA-directed RNA polymerase subunit beta